MAQYRQSGGVFDRLSNGDVAGSDTHVIGIRAPSRHHRHKKPLFSIPLLLFLFSVALIATFFFAFYYLSQDVVDRSDENDDEEGSGADFLANVTRIDKSNVKFERGSVGNVWDSRDWDRRRDKDYDEESAENVNVGVVKERLSDIIGTVQKVQDEGKLGLMVGKGGDGVRKKGAGLYNEAGRDELKVYEAEYEASLKNAGVSVSGKVIEGENKELEYTKSGKSYDSMLADEYDDGMAMESVDDHAKDYDNDDDDDGKHSEKLSNEAEAHDLDDQSSEVDGAKSNFLGVDKDHDDTVTDYTDNEFSSITEETKNPSPVKSSKSSGSEKRKEI